MYLIDTNILIEGSRRYPFEIFPGYWRELENLSVSGKLFFHEKVKDEIVVWGDQISDWFNKTVAPATVLKINEEELSSYRDLVVWTKEKRLPLYKPEAVTEFLSVADSWMVASANSRDFKIVTYEAGAPNGTKRVKIPDAAQAFGVQCIDPIQMLRNEQIVVS